MASPKRNFRVVISGGSVAGLTLALALRRKNIDFVVLEARDEVAPQEGASISINGSAGPALDQLGVLDDVLKETEALTRHVTFDEHGKNWAILHSPELMAQRHLYPLVFLERQFLLQILYDHLAEAKDSVLTNKKVTKVETFDTHILAHCADGSSYEGDLIVGADGVRSVVREHMWNYMESHDLKEEAVKERERMECTYECTFGISSATPGLRTGDILRTLGEGWTFLTIIGKDDKVFWFLIKKLDRTYKGSEIPRLNKGNIDEHVAAYLHLPVTDTISFAEVYKNVVVANRVALEEVIYDRWTIDRVALVGDAIHKIAPNSGQGGMMAVEDGVSLTNSIVKLLKSCPQPNTEDFNSCLQDWQAGRSARVTGIVAASNAMVRAEALDNFQAHVMKWVYRWLTPILLSKVGAYYKGAELLDDTPYPERAKNAPVPYERAPKPWKGPENAWKRALWGVPIVGLFAGACVTMGALIDVVVPGLVTIFNEGVYTASSGEVIDAVMPIYNVPILDKTFIPMIIAFLPTLTKSHPQSWTQSLTFVTDAGAMYGIWLLEAYRKANKVAEVALPMTIGTAFQLRGIGILGPIYYLIEYLRGSTSRLLPGNLRDIEFGTSVSLLAALGAGHYLPNFAAFLVPGLQDRRWWNAAWQVFPITVPLLQAPLALIANKGAEKRTAEPRRKPNKKSLIGTRVVYGSMAMISAATYLYAWYTRPVGSTLTSIFWPSFKTKIAPGLSFSDGMALFLQYDQVFSMASGFVWLGLRFRELKRAGVSFSWPKALAGLVGTTYAFGPGTAFSLGWGWKEELLNKLPEHKW